MAEVALKDGEIVGLGSENNGRSCQQHAICGSSIAVGSLVRFRSCVLEMDDGKIEQVINLPHVLFLPHVILFVVGSEGDAYYRWCRNMHCRLPAQKCCSQGTSSL